MPRHPHIAPTAGRLHNSPFSKLAERIAEQSEPPIPLHVGDSWRAPPPGAHMSDLRQSDHPGLNRYARPQGHPALLSAVSAIHDLPTDQILVTPGATGALSALSRTLLSPEDEVILLTPCWPLIRGIVPAAGAQVVEVPFYDRLGRGVAALLEPHVTPRTAAIYVCTPNNPTGNVLTADQLSELADVARAHDLWLWSDEVYSLYAYARPHHPLFEIAPERTFAAYSFSKAWAMAGNRCGYLLGPTASVMSEVRKLSMHGSFSTVTASQLAGVAALEHGAAWLAESRRAYQAAGIAAAAALGVPEPEGGTFLLLDVANHLDDRGLDGFLSDCLDRGLLLAPGSSCGVDFPTHVRLCFTSARPEVVAEGVARLAALLGGDQGS